jgi:hypothetical protein
VTDADGAETTRRPILFIGIAGLCFLVLIGGAVVSGVPGTPCNEELSFDSPPSELTLSYANATDSLTVTYTGERPLVHYPDSGHSSGKRTVSIYLRLKDGQTGETTQHIIAHTTDEFPISNSDEFSVTAKAFGKDSFAAGDEITLVWNRTQARLPNYCLTSRDPSPLATSVDRETIRR